MMSDIKSKRSLSEIRSERLGQLNKAQKLSLLCEKQDNYEYFQIISLIPDYAPKNVGIYRRMKKAQSARFIELAEKATEAGVKIVYNKS